MSDENKYKYIEYKIRVRVPYDLNIPLPIYDSVRKSIIESIPKVVIVKGFPFYLDVYE